MRWHEAQRISGEQLLGCHADDDALVLKRHIQIAVWSLTYRPEPPGHRRPRSLNCSRRNSIGTDLQYVQTVSDRCTVNADTGVPNHHATVPVFPLFTSQESVGEHAL